MPARTAALALLVLLVGAWLPDPVNAAAQPRMGEAMPAPIQETRLFDIGVADYDDDAWLDLFTINHKFRSVLLRNEDGRRLVDRTAAAGLSPSPAFPGFEYLKPPRIAADGLYIWATDAPGEPARIEIRTRGTAAAGGIRFLNSKVRVERRRGSSAGVATDAAGRRTARFAIGPRGAVTLRVKLISDQPITVSLDPPIEPRKIRVGALAVRPAERDFTLILRDRHGYAFADVIGNRATDLFVISGGIGGAISYPGYTGLITDELLRNGGAGYRNVIGSSGIRKGRCRGRQAAWVDFDADGLLDLSQGCEGRRPQLFEQIARGEFRRVASPRTRAGTYRWAFLSRQRQRPLLIASGKRRLELWRMNRSGRMRPVQSLPAGSRAEQLALADYDHDGDLDVLAVSRKGNALLENRRGRLHAVSLRRHGLPPQSVAASFVDFDNDARTDLHLIPQGIFRWAGSRYRPTGRLRTGPVAAGILNWFDADGDGRRDPVIATGSRAFAPRFDVRRHRNLTRAGSWLQVDLAGAAGNGEAIGARVSAKVGGRWVHQWVGQNDDARYSQGHYRLYFGLGRARRVERLTVRWPDGSQDTHADVAANRLVTIEQG